MDNDVNASMDKASCGSAIAELYEYLDGALTEERRAAIHAHIELCSPCLDAFDFEAELRTVISSRCRDSVPDELRSKIADALRDLE